MVKTGIELITEERRRQIEEEGYIPENDIKLNKNNELTYTAIYFIHPNKRIAKKFYPKQWNKIWAKKDKHDRIKQLKIAGALIAAEIDRLNKLQITDVLKKSKKSFNLRFKNMI